MGVSQVILIISVMTTMGALAALQSFMVERDMATSLIHINFNETLLSTAISEVIPESGLSVARSERRQPLRLAPWDLNASQLVGIDNALALARLRMDIESELRRIAHEAHIDLSIRPVGVIGLARELAAKEIVPPALLN